MWGSFMLLMLLLVLGCKLFVPEMERYWILADINRIMFAVLYWYVAFVAVPRWRGYRIEEEVDVLSDGTSVTKLVRIKV